MVEANPKPEGPPPVVEPEKAVSFAADDPMEPGDAVPVAVDVSGGVDTIADSHIAVAAAPTEPASLDALQQQIKDLQAQLEDERTKRGVAEAAALAAAEAQGGLMQREIREIPTGKTVKVKRLDPANPYRVVGHKDDGREILRPNFAPVELPTFFYKIDLPPSGGLGVKINGRDLFHGTTYELDIDTLRTVKDTVFKCWKHDADISGSNENAYRPKLNPVVSARAFQ